MSIQSDQQLRDEILETQKARSDLLKWKLLLIAAIGSVGLGLHQSTRIPYAPFVLCGIPFVCFYVDLLCAHLSLRIMVINRYFTLKTVCPAADYESLCSRARSVFGLETLALQGTTITLSLLLVGLGSLFLIRRFEPDAPFFEYLNGKASVCLAVLIMLAGLFGFFSAWLVPRIHNKKLAELDAIVTAIKHESDTSAQCSSTP